MLFGQLGTEVDVQLDGLVREQSAETIIWLDGHKLKSKINLYEKFKELFRKPDCELVIFE